MSETGLKAMLGTLENQRNQALNAIVQLSAQLAELTEQLKAANDKLEKKKAK